jgi:hypothetical protein
MIGKPLPAAVLLLALGVALDAGGDAQGIVANTAPPRDTKWQDSRERTR